MVKCLHYIDLLVVYTTSNHTEQKERIMPLIAEAILITRHLENKIANTYDHDSIAKIIEKELNQLGAVFVQAYIEETWSDDESGEDYQVNYTAFYKHKQSIFMIDAYIPQEADATIAVVPLSSETFENNIRALEENENACKYNPCS